MADSLKNFRLGLWPTTGAMRHAGPERLWGYPPAFKRRERHCPGVKIYGTSYIHASTGSVNCCGNSPTNAGSPSCGSSYSYDGSFKSVRLPLPGVTTAALEEAGVRVFSEHQLDAAAAFLVTLDQ